MISLLATKRHASFFIKIRKMRAARFLTKPEIDWVFQADTIAVRLLMRSPKEQFPYNLSKLYSIISLIKETQFICFFLQRLIQKFVLMIPMFF